MKGGIHITKQGQIPTSHRKKAVIIAALYVSAAVIALAGFILSIYSLVQNISFNVLGSKVPGVVFDLVIIFLGLRYFLSVKKLKNEVFRDDSNFSWSNFRRESKQ